MPTIQSHYDRLKQTDLATWRAMNSELVSVTSNRGSHMLTYFERSVLGREKVNDRPDLRSIQMFIGYCLMKYLGFTMEDIVNDRVPEFTDKD